MADDTFSKGKDTPSSPSRSMVTVTPHATNEIAGPPKALYIGTAGNVTLRAMDDDVDVVFKNVPAGATLPVRARFVRASGTTASDILAYL